MMRRRINIAAIGPRCSNPYVCLLFVCARGPFGRLKCLMLVEKGRDREKCVYKHQAVIKRKKASAEERERERDALTGKFGK